MYTNSQSGFKLLTAHTAIQIAHISGGWWQVYHTNPPPPPPPPPFYHHRTYMYIHRQLPYGRDCKLSSESQWRLLVARAKLKQWRWWKRRRMVEIQITVVSHLIVISNLGGFRTWRWNGSNTQTACLLIHATASNDVHMRPSNMNWAGNLLEGCH